MHRALPTAALQRGSGLSAHCIATHSGNFMQSPRRTPVQPRGAPPQSSPRPAPANNIIAYLANLSYSQEMKKRAAFAQQAKMLKALANESRLMIVDRLGRGECSVGDLREIVGSDLSTVSKHLSLLRAHGIVDDRREGTTVYYRLLTPCVCNFFTCATQVLKERAR